MTAAPSRYGLAELVREYRLACVRRRGVGCACRGCELLAGPPETKVAAVVRAYLGEHARGRCGLMPCVLDADSREALGMGETS